MDNNERDFDSLSEMLSKNKADQKAKRDEILNSFFGDDDFKKPNNKRSSEPLILNGEKKEAKKSNDSVEITPAENKKAYKPVLKPDVKEVSDDTGATRLIANVSEELPKIAKSNKTVASVQKEKKPVPAHKAKENRPKKTPSDEKPQKRTQAEIRKEKTKRSIITGVMLTLSLALTAAIVFVSVKLGIYALDSLLDYTGLSTTQYEAVIEIPENPTTSEVSQILYDNGIITSKKLFEAYVDMKEVGSDFVAGEFELSSVMSYSQIIGTLQASKDEIVTVELRIIEGMTAREIGLLLEENHVCRAEDFSQFYLEKMNLYSFEKRVDYSRDKFYQLEGYLFPDTYEFYVCNELAEDPDADIDTSKEAQEAAKKIYSNFSTKISKSMYKLMNEQGFTLNDVITLASIIQKEAGTVEDMGLIASVFINRLNSPDEFPCLESDVTVFYVENEISPYHKDVETHLSYRALADNYNTYIAKGIPAGPICSPGMDAIKAVLEAPETNYYFFCANEETLETFYATTVEEHEQNLIAAGITKTE